MRNTLLGTIAGIFAGLGLVAGIFWYGDSRAVAQEETTENTAGQEFQGVLDSYAAAQEEIDAEGGETEAGGYRVGYIVEPAEGWWEGPLGSLTWREPVEGETNHIEILPFEEETGLFVPGVNVTLTVLDEAGEEVESKPLSMFRSEFYHYSNNFSLPESGTYTLRAEIDPSSAFLRHGSEDGEGRVLTEPATVEFEGVEIDTEE